MSKKKNVQKKDQSKNQSQNGSGNAQHLPYMSLLMIVKNESHVILQTLELLHPHIDYWIICDTGSTDGTQDLIQNFFAEKKIPGELFQHEWKNFGHNRTLAFECAFNKSKYVFVFDADDLIHGNFVVPKDMNKDAYNLKFGTIHTYTRPQIFKNSLRWRYRGVLHEFAECINKKNAAYAYLHGDYHIESRRLGSRNADPDKYLKDAQTLMRAITDGVDPDLKGRYLFYLAQSYRDYNDTPNAIKYYMERANFPGWEEESYYSCWQVGLLMYKIKSYTDNDRMYWFLKGHRFCPNRGEVLTEIGKIHFNNNDMQKAYYYFEMVTKMPLSVGGLFLDESSHITAPQVYLSIICLHINKLQECDFYMELLNKNKIITETDIANIKCIENHKSKNILFRNNIQFNDFVFYPYQDVFGSDIYYENNTVVEDLYAKAKTLENCNAFNTIGYFKNIDLSNYTFIDFLNERHMIQIHGIYIKKVLL
jgi:hypothetical protein